MVSVPSIKRRALHRRRLRDEVGVGSTKEGLVFPTKPPFRFSNQFVVQTLVVFIADCASLSVL